MVLTKEIIFKRLSTAKIQQESVETLSAWILHHVKNISTVSRVWFEVYIGAKDDLKITLIYVLNDVIQKSRKLPGDIPSKICTVFFYHLRYAILVSSDAVKVKIKRVVGILSSRDVLSKTRQTELSDILEGRLYRMVPTELNFYSEPGSDPPPDAVVLDDTQDKYRNLINKLVEDEGILKFNLSCEPDAKKSRVDMESLVDACDDHARQFDSTMLMQDCLKVYEKKDAIAVAQKAGKEGPFADEDLDLTVFKKEGYNVKTKIPIFKDVEYQAKSVKKVRALQIQQLKEGLKPKKEEKKDESYVPSINGSQDSADVYDVPHYSPGADDNSSEQYSVHSVYSSQSRQFLDSIPLPKPVDHVPLDEIALPSRYAPTYLPSSFLGDDAPPGVDDPSKDMSVVLPTPLPYDPMQTYSPSFPQQYVMSSPNPSKHEGYSPTGSSYSPGFVGAGASSSRHSSSHEYNARNDHDSRDHHSRRSHDSYQRREQRSRY